MEKIQKLNAFVQSMNTLMSFDDALQDIFNYTEQVKDNSKNTRIGKFLFHDVGSFSSIYKRKTLRRITKEAQLVSRSEAGRSKSSICGISLSPMLCLILD